MRPGIEQELAEAEKRDPLKRLSDWLIANGLASASDLERLQQEEETKIEAAYKAVAAELK